MPVWLGKSADEVPLWDDNPPGVVEGAGPGVNDGTWRLRNVGIPSLWMAFPNRPGIRRPAVVLCPGGAYNKLAATTIVRGVAEPFLADGFVVIVLKYRVSPPSPSVENDALADARRAMRLVRLRAEEWGVDPHRIGMIGWSAGGNLVLNLVSHPDHPNAQSADLTERLSSRPDYVGLLCPWPNHREIGDFPISPEAPPAFVASARDDSSAPTQFAESIAAMYEANGVACEFWQIEEGGHGAFSWNAKGEGQQWRIRFLSWLEKIFPGISPRR